MFAGAAAGKGAAEGRGAATGAGDSAAPSLNARARTTGIITSSATNYGG